MMSWTPSASPLYFLLLLSRHVGTQANEPFHATLDTYAESSTTTHSPGIRSTTQETDAIKRLFGSKAPAKHPPVRMAVRLVLSVPNLQVHTGDTQICLLHINGHPRCLQNILVLSQRCIATVQIYQPLVLNDTEQV